MTRIRNPMLFRMLRNMVTASVLIVMLPSGALSAQQPSGQDVYRRECRNCHGANGTPQARALEQYPKIVTFADSAFFDRRSQDSIVAVLRRGVGRDMKSFRDKLTTAEMQSVAAYIRTLARRRGPAGQ